MLDGISEEYEQLVSSGQFDQAIKLCDDSTLDKSATKDLIDLSLATCLLKAYSIIEKKAHKKLDHAYESIREQIAIFMLRLLETREEEEEGQTPAEDMTDQEMRLQERKKGFIKNITLLLFAQDVVRLIQESSWRVPAWRANCFGWELEMSRCLEEGIMLPGFEELSACLEEKGDDQGLESSWEEEKEGSGVHMALV